MTENELHSAITDAEVVKEMVLKRLYLENYLTIEDFEYIKSHWAITLTKKSWFTRAFKRKTDNNKNERDFYEYHWIHNFSMADESSEYASKTKINNSIKQVDELFNNLKKDNKDQDNG